MTVTEISEISVINDALNDLFNGNINRDFLNHTFDEAPSEEVILLAENIKRLIKHFDEVEQFISVLSVGKLNIKAPKNSCIVAPLIDLQANLFKFTNQIKEVADGNYEQNLTFMGELSDEFNKLIKSLHGKKQLENALKESDERFRLIIDILPFPIMLIKVSDSNIYYANKKCAELLGTTQELLCKQKVSEYFALTNEKNFNPEEMINNEFRMDEEILLKRGNGEVFCALMTSVITNDLKEQIIIASLEDITERKYQDEEKEKLLEELEISKEQIEEEAGKMVQLNVQLERSEEKLQELNASKDKLFSIIGHDLKNPFFVISSYTEILNEDYNELTNEEKINFIRIIGETSRFAHRLLENLLHWARAQTGRIDYIPEGLHLKKMVNTSIQLLNSQASKKEIELVTDVNPAYMVNADKNMLDTVLRNLVSNAIKFTNAGGMVKVVAKEVDDMIQIGVTDTGIGLSEKDISKLFRIDVQNSEIGTSKEKGTGLGLILCKEFVERHGGRIWVESEIGKGSKFNFLIPKI